MDFFQTGVVHQISSIVIARKMKNLTFYGIFALENICKDQASNNQFQLKPVLSLLAGEFIKHNPEEELEEQLLDTLFRICPVNMVNRLPKVDGFVDKLVSILGSEPIDSPFLMSALRVVGTISAGEQSLTDSLFHRNILNTL